MLHRRKRGLCCFPLVPGDDAAEAFLPFDWACGCASEIGGDDVVAGALVALLGAVYGLDAIPAQWVDRVLNCRPKTGHPGVNRPRPECFWPVDALELAEGLIGRQGALP
jgi:hypothetical protein